LEINKQIADIGEEKVNAVFLVTRADLIVTNEDYKDLLSTIKSAIKQPLKVISFLIVSHDLYFVNSDRPNVFLKILKSEFGQPVSYQDKKAYIFRTYASVTIKG